MTITDRDSAAVLISPEELADLDEAVALADYRAQQAAGTLRTVGLDPLPPGADEEPGEEHLYTVLPRRLLLRYVADPALRSQVRSLIRSGRWSNPLLYPPERDPRRLAYVVAAQLNQVRKFHDHYPVAAAREQRERARLVVARSRT